MKSIKIFLVAACFALPALQGFSQEGKLSLNLNYSIQSPTGSFKSDIVSKPSYAGWNASLLYGITDKLSVGLQTGSAYFNEKYPRQVYDTKDGSISAVLTNTVQTVPLQLKARYMLTNAGFIRPYVAVGAGGNIVSYNQYLGEFGSNKTGFYFAATPEAGVKIPFGKSSNSGITIGGNYNYVPFHYAGIKSLDNWGLFAGVQFPLR